MKIDKSGLVKNIFKLIFILIIVMFVCTIYRKYNFNDMIKRQTPNTTTKFSRDYNEKYNSKPSYKIENVDSTDAMFCKKISVTPDSVYKVKCKVKTENVQSSNQESGGAQICISDTIEKSYSIRGTNDWQDLEFMFNSKDRTSLEIGFRLGGYDSKASGMAWFSDFSIEMGSADQTNKWKFACVVFENLDVTLNGNGGATGRYNFSMTNNDITDMKQNMERFKSSIATMTNQKMSAEYDFFTVDEPITNISYDDENGYFISPSDIEATLYPYIKGKGYDYIFICVRMGDETKEIPVNEWIGLGGMEYLGMGFSNIRLPNNSRSYQYKYDSRVNTFPEEVFVHEFIHTLEKNSQDEGYDVIESHDYEKYGYKASKTEGLKQWYYDYLNKKINNNTLGLPEKIYTVKPAKDENFQYAYNLDLFNEPQNLIEEIRMLFKQLQMLFNTVKGE